MFEERIHALREAGPIVDIRNLGLMGAIEMEALAEEPGRRGITVFERAFDAGLVIRTTADTIALSPPLVISEDQLHQMFDLLDQALRTLP